MERPDNSVQSSFAESSHKFDQKRKRIYFLHIDRNSNYLFQHKGKDCWHFLLVDCDKENEYLEKSRKEGTIELKEYGKILVSGLGHDVPESVKEVTAKFIQDLETQLFIFKLRVTEEVYYVLCDADKKREIVASRTAEEVGRCGKILHSSMDEDPPEALWDVIERGYFGPTEERRFDVCSRGVEAARSGDLQKVQDFLEEEKNVDWTDANGWTMLHHAAHCGDLNMISILKDMNANIQVCDNICGRKPIHIAAREGHPRVVELLLINNDSVNDVDRSGWTPLHYAAWKGKSDTVKYLISKKANTEITDRCWGKKPIHVAVAEGRIPIVQIFLDNGADIDDVDAKGRSLIYHSAMVGIFEMTKFLIDRNANVTIANEIGVRPLHVYTEHDNTQLLELLLSHGSDIESRNFFKETPLHYAAYYGGIKVVQMLVDKGANLSSKNEDGKTPFDLAMEKKHFEKASYLAERMFEVFRDQEEYNEALSISEKLLEIQIEKLGQDHPKTLRTQHNVALMLYHLGKYEAAMETLNVVLNKRQDILGLNDFDTLCTKYEKGRVYVAQWKLDKASAIFQGVHTNWQDTLGPAHHRTLSVAREIAFVHFNKCEFDKALKIFEDVYEKRKLSSDMDDPVTLQALQDVAIVLVNKGENKNALRILEDVLARRKTCLGAQHPETLFAGYHIQTVQKRLANTTEEGRCCLQ